jgi:hypothetical protein
MKNITLYPRRENWTNETLYYSEETDISWELYKRNFSTASHPVLPTEYHPMKILSVSKGSSGYWPDESHGKFMVDSMNTCAAKRVEEVKQAEERANPMLHTGKLPVAAGISICPPSPTSGLFGNCRWVATHVPTKKWLHEPFNTQAEVVAWCKERGIHVLGGAA